MRNFQRKHITLQKAWAVIKVDSRKKGRGSRDSQNPPQAIKKPNIKEKIKWVNEKKVKLVLLDEQARNRGIGFMGRLKRAWDECYPEFRHLNM